VLDFFMGSGTIPAVCHKMGLKYIGIEQMDYIEDISIKRLTNVIAGNDKKGVTKAVNWKGGGSFVYCELAKLNQEYVDLIQGASTSDELRSIYELIIRTGFISSKVDVKTINSSVSDFDSLSTIEKKTFLMELLDNNLLYVNYCDIDDEEFKISDNDKAFTNSFYKGK